MKNKLLWVSVPVSPELFERMNRCRRLLYERTGTYLPQRPFAAACMDFGIEMLESRCNGGK